MIVVSFNTQKLGQVIKPFKTKQKAIEYSNKLIKKGRANVCVKKIEEEIIYIPGMEMEE